MDFSDSESDSELDDNVPLKSNGKSSKSTLEALASSDSEPEGRELWDYSSSDDEDVSKKKPKRVRPKSTFKKSKYKQISSHGRRRDRFGAVGWGGVHPSGYRNQMEIGRDRNGRAIQLKIHTLVQVYANDPDLKEWTKAKKRDGGTQPTVDHENQVRTDNYHWNLGWATKSEQRQNRTITEEAKANYQSKRSKGRVQVREWTGCVYKIRVGATGGTPNEWDDELVFVGQCEAGRHTGQGDGTICRRLDDGQPHFHKESGKFWEYRLVADEVDPDEVWRSVPRFAAEFGVQVSNMGRVKTKKTQATRGSKIDGVYRSIKIDGKHRKVHDLVGRAFFGDPPTSEHTIDHKHPSVYDDDGCLSNAPKDLAGWADRSQQCTTSANVSRAATVGKRVRVVDKTTKEVTEYTDTYSAAAALGLSAGMVGNVCNGVVNSTKYEMSFVEEPNLIRTRFTLFDGEEVEVEDVERWFDVDPVDWDVGGKYHCIRHAPVTRNEPPAKKRKAPAKPEAAKPKKPKKSVISSSPAEPEAAKPKKSVISSAELDALMLSSDSD